MRHVVVVLSLAACGGGSGSPSPDGDGGSGLDGSTSSGPVAIDNYAAAYASAACMKEFMCCTAAETGVLTEAGCESNAKLGENALVSAYESSIAMGRTVYSATGAEACITAMQNLSCSDFQMLHRIPAACTTGVVTGTVANEGACTYDFDCVSANCITSVCKPTPTQGQTCNQTCASGLYCTDDPKSCQPLKANGTSCAMDTECTSLYCDTTCMPPPAVCDGH